MSDRSPGSRGRLVLTARRDRAGPGTVLIATAMGLFCIAFVLASAATVGARSRTQSCGLLAFATHSDEGAFDIRALAATCRQARTVVAGARAHPVTHPGAVDHYYTKDGFASIGHDVSHGKEEVSSRCRRRGSVITFHRSGT